MELEYIEYIRQTIVETIAATNDEQLLQYVYTMMTAANSLQDSSATVKQDS